ncbi:MAG: glycogen debranching enzyme family protein [Planctomycetes bacterium]|nr:glycogen debranching enzyme family protein [Planctomycetota bacterium]
MRPSRARPRRDGPPREGASLALDADTCRDLPVALAREWLETDGHGGYAALSVPFAPTRRQHGLLVAPFEGNARRHVFLSRFEETLVVGGRAIPLSTGLYPGVVSPHGHATLEGFDATPWPTAVHRAGEVRVVREVLLPGDAGVVLVRWRVEGAPGPATLELRPLLPCRESDALTHENQALHPRWSVTAAGVRCRPYPELPAVALAVDGAPHVAEASPTWYRRVEHPTDLARGYEGHEDVFSPGVLRVRLPRDGAVVVAASLGRPVAHAAARFQAAARTRRRAWREAGPGLAGLLAHGADRFLVRRPDGAPAVVAGLPWFGAWSRDTAIAVPGLFFARGRVEAGGDVLEATLRYLRDGALPNRLGATPPDGDGLSADGALWLALAVRRYDDAGGRDEHLRATFLPALRAVLAGLRDGRGAVTLDDDGLPVVAPHAAAATWMDARADGTPITPRDGTPVELAALVVSLHAHLAALEARGGDRAAATAHRRAAARAGEALVARLWLPAQRRLADRSVAGRPDPAHRPNALVAAALEDVPLSTAQRRDVVRAAEAALVTPCGLRTLAPDDDRYRARYEGDVVARDAAYHQGTVWPWLAGFHVEATLRAFGRGPRVRARLRAWLDGFAPAAAAMGLGHLPEVLDGDPPHRPGGTFAQAWSDAEWLRAHALLGGATGPAPARRASPTGRPR